MSAKESDSSEAEKADFNLRPARDVNRELRRERELEKSRNAVSLRHAGDWVPLLEEACGKKRAKDVVEQVNYLYAEGTLWSGIGNERKVSHDTSTKSVKTVQMLFADLRMLGTPLKDVRHLNRRHVVKVIKHWLEKPVPNKSATIQTKAACIRRFLSLIGKMHAMPKGSAWTTILQAADIDTALLKRHYVADISKSWMAAGIHARQKIDEIWAESPVCGAALLLQAISGCRVKESLSDSPILMDCDSFLRLINGTKGGRKRDVRLAVTEEQMAIARADLERVKAVAAKQPRKLLCVKGKNFKQMRRHYYYILNKHGISLRDEGVTSHGLRHEFLQKRFQDVSGLPPYVDRKAPPAVYAQYADEVKKGNGAVMDAAGHGQHRTGSAYLGSLMAMTAQGAAAEEAMALAVVSNPHTELAFVSARVITAWLIGNIAYGVKLEEEEPLEICVLLPLPADHAVVQHLQDTMEAALARPVNLVAQYDPLKRPHVGTELVFPHQRISRASPPVKLAPAGCTCRTRPPV